MPPERYASIIDVHVILRRAGQVLLLRRTGDTFASGQLCLTGHLEAGESVLDAAVRETLEETALSSTPTHSRMPCPFTTATPRPGTPRSGSLSRPAPGPASRSTPSRASTPNWPGFSAARLPPDTVGYGAAVITAAERGLPFTLNGW